MWKGREIMWIQQIINTKRNSNSSQKELVNPFALHTTIHNSMQLAITLRMFSLPRIVYSSLIYETLVIL